MISVKNIFKQIRIDLKDINEVQYSTWDLENALNKALRLICNHFSTKNTDFLTRSVAMCDTPIQALNSPPVSFDIGRTLHGTSLPNDFISIVKVMRPDGYELHPSTGHIHDRNYLIYREVLFTLGPAIMTYRFMIPNVSEKNKIDLPISFFDFVVEATKTALTENTGMLTQYIADNAENLIPGRKYTNARVRLPWRV